MGPRRSPPFKRLLRPFRAPVEDDVDEELRLHLELSAEALQKREGLEAGEAKDERRGEALGDGRPDRPRPDGVQPLEAADQLGG